MGLMSLLDVEENGTDDTSPPPPSPGRWIALVMLIVALAAGAGYFYVSRNVDAPETTALVEPARPAAPPRAAEAPAAPNPAAEPIREPTVSPAPVARPAARIAPPSAAVRLRVTSDVEGADVFIDRRFAGKTPYESTDVTDGRHRINVSAPGFDGFSDDIEIGDTLTELDVAFAVVRLDQRVAVVHDHRFGECVGQLVASVDGIRYETVDDDAFSVALDMLEEFDMDYVEHNLRLKIRDGRRYNFTDTEATADALFVFHRQVEDARLRLAAGS